MGTEGDDERFERAMEFLKRCAREHEDRELVRMERGLEEAAHVGPPPPLSWHPFYRGQTWLLDWLEGRGAFAGNRVLIPKPQPRASLFHEPEPMSLAENTITMTKSKAWGAAPYVGRPFVYVWYVGTDDLGRSIASDSRIVYPDGEDTRG